MTQEEFEALTKAQRENLLEWLLRATGQGGYKPLGGSPEWRMLVKHSKAGMSKLVMRGGKGKLRKEPLVP